MKFHLSLVFLKAKEFGLRPAAKMGSKKTHFFVNFAKTKTEYVYRYIIVLSAMVKLNTGWRHWDKHLSKFTELDEPIHAMEIGSYEGDATVWLLNNLCSKNDKSFIYCLDTWTGSPEYVNINFMDVEKKFDENTGFSKKVKKIKGLSHGSLIKLLAQDMRPEFHVIFIDASMKHVMC
jgi:hypothetical protein